MPKDLVTLDRALLAFADLAARGLPPSLREYAEALDLVSTSSAKYWITQLVDEGYVVSVGDGERRRMSRGLVLTDAGRTNAELLRSKGARA
jgi:SOS-response transcriptional repressor LexA